MTTTVNSAQYKECVLLLSTDTVIASYMRIILDAIKIAKIYPMHNSMEDISEDFIKYLTDYWYIHIDEIIQSILCLGIIPIKIFKTKDNIPDFRIITYAVGVSGDIRIIIDPNTYAISYQYYIINSGETEESVLVFSGFGYDPEPITGRLTSIISTLIPHYLFMKVNYKFNLQALHTLSRPPILINKGKDMGFAADELLPFADSNIIDDQTDILSTYNRHDGAAGIHKDLIDKVLHRYNNEDIGAQTHILKNNIFPAFGTIERQIQPELRADWEVLHQIYLSYINMAFGIPKEFQTHTVSAVNISFSYKQFDTTIKAWKKRICDIFSKLYVNIFTDDELIFVISHIITEDYATIKQKRDDHVISTDEFLILTRQGYTF